MKHFNSTKLFFLLFHFAEGGFLQSTLFSDSMRFHYFGWKNNWNIKSLWIWKLFAA